ncbi:MAG TPA: hypothetical protein VHE33_15380 [Acidobacteriaceae bacterium]|nr:hypothetical protein [Acidobacteriaceae bacterium]
MALTVTATASGTGSVNGTSLVVRVLNNASLTQNGATANSSTVTTPQISITPHATGSMIYGSIVTDITSLSSLDANTTALVNQAASISGNGVATYAGYRSTSLTASTSAATYGWGAPTVGAGEIFIASAEILASGGTLNEDASSPAAAWNPSSLSATTASFTPPASAVLVAIVGAGWNTSGSTAVTVTDSASAYNWSQLSGVPTTDSAAIWVGIPKNTSVTVSAGLATATAAARTPAVTNSGTAAAGLAAATAQAAVSPVNSFLRDTSGAQITDTAGSPVLDTSAPLTLNVLIQPGAGRAQGTAQALAASASSSSAVTAGRAQATAAALAPSVTVSASVTAGLATAAATAQAPAAQVTPPAGRGQSSAAAQAPAAAVTATAGLAQATAAALAPSVTASGNAVAGLATAAAAAQAPTVTESGSANAGLATATGAAQAPAAALTAAAGIASGSTAAKSPTAQVTAQAGLAHAAAQGLAPAVSAAFSAGRAQATGTAQAPAALVQPGAGRAQATGTAYNAPVSSDITVTAGLATATATAQSVTTHLVRPPLHLGASVSYLQYGGEVSEETLGGSAATVANLLGGSAVPVNAYGGSLTTGNSLLGGTSTPVSNTFGGTLNYNAFGGSLTGWTMQQTTLAISEFNDETINIAITNNGSPYNLTGVTVQMLFKTAAGTPDNEALVFSSSGGSPAITITNAAGGLATAVIPNTDLDAETYNFFRIDVVVSGLINTCLYGPITWTSL